MAHLQQEVEASDLSSSSDEDDIEEGGHALLVAPNTKRHIQATKGNAAGKT